MFKPDKIYYEENALKYRLGKEYYSKLLKEAKKQNQKYN